jgi:hypothetical protein
LLIWLCVALALLCQTPTTSEVGQGALATLAEWVNGSHQVLQTIVRARERVSESAPVADANLIARCLHINHHLVVVVVDRTDNCQTTHECNWHSRPNLKKYIGCLLSVVGCRSLFNVLPRCVPCHCRPLPAPSDVSVHGTTCHQELVNA